MDFFLKKYFRIVVGYGLNILRQSHERGTGCRWIHHCRDCLRQGNHELRWVGDAIPKTRTGLECVRHRH